MGRCPDAPDLKQDEGVAGVGEEGSILVGLFPAASAPLLLGLHKSLSAAFSWGIPTFFPRLCPASHDSRSLPNDPEFGHCFSYLSFPRTVVLCLHCLSATALGSALQKPLWPFLLGGGMLLLLLQ